MDKAEYVSLQDKTIEIDALELVRLRAAYKTLFESHNVYKICPECHERYLIDGNICFNCGYDDSDRMYN